MWARKFLHWARPMVWAPDRTVMSLALRPLAAKREMRVERFPNGGGIWALAALRLAVVASLRPSCTVHACPPNYTQVNTYKINKYFITRVVVFVFYYKVDIFFMLTF